MIEIFKNSNRSLSTKIKKNRNLTEKDCSLEIIKIKIKIHVNSLHYF